RLGGTCPWPDRAGGTVLPVGHGVVGRRLRARDRALRRSGLARRPGPRAGRRDRAAGGGGRRRPPRRRAGPDPAGGGRAGRAGAVLAVGAAPASAGRELRYAGVAGVRPAGPAWAGLPAPGCRPQCWRRAVGLVAAVGPAGIAGGALGRA